MGILANDTESHHVKSCPPIACRRLDSWQIRKLPAALRRSLAWDRGLGMAKRKTFTVVNNVTVYCYDPHGSWQRGTKRPTACCDETCASERTRPDMRTPIRTT
jgi:hypothetical protein